MDSRTAAILSIFIHRYNPKAEEALLHFLPAEDRQAVQRHAIRSADFTPLLMQPHQVLSNMHYSWIQPLLEKFPPSLHPLLLSALTIEQVKGFQPIATPSPMSPPVRAFIVNYLYQHLQADQRLPLDYLPVTELSPLAQWTKSKLTLLIDFLGIHDLASEVRRIVNKHHLQNIYSCLSPKQYAYLNVCLHQREVIVAPKLEIDLTKRNNSQLKLMLHRRGLARLTKALSGQHADLVWYIAHILDSGRGHIVLNTYQLAPPKNVTHLLKNQVINLMNFLKNE